MVTRGQTLYWQCFRCHGSNVVAKGMAPDLRASPIPLNQDAFSIVVRDGAKADMGMPAFKNFSDDDLRALMHFIRKKANEHRQEVPDNQREGL